MPQRPGESEFAARPDAIFDTTRWSVVAAAGSDDSTCVAVALQDLCQRYWYPLYAFVRRRGYAHADAADLTQSFFAHLIEKRGFAGVSPGPARFRSFLLGALKNFLNNEWVSARRLKRGGGQQIISLDESAAEELYVEEMFVTASPDKLFEKRWALSVAELALGKLRREFAASERAELFDALKGALTEDQILQPYEELAATFHLSEGALRIAVHRLRKRFGELLRAEVGQTVKDPTEVEDELRFLVRILSE